MKRILTAALLIVAVFALIFFGQLWMLTVAACLAAELAAYEYLTLANTGGTRIPAWWMAAAVALLFLVTYYRPTEAQLPVLSALALILLAWAGFRAPLDRVLPDAALGLFGLIYVGYPLTLLPMIWNRDDGKALLVFLMVCVWAVDIKRCMLGAALGGTSHRRPSPNKTWEGSMRVGCGERCSPGWRWCIRASCWRGAGIRCCILRSRCGSRLCWL